MKFLIIAFLTSMSSVVFATTHTYECSNGVNLTISYAQIESSQIAKKLAISGDGQLDGEYSPLGDGSFFKKEGSPSTEVMLSRALFVAEQSGTLVVPGGSNLACQATN